MNQHAAEAIAVAATMETARRRTRRWKVVVAVVILAGVGREVSNRVELPRPQVRAAVKAAQAAAPQPVQHPRIQQPAAPSQPTTARRSEAAAAARAKRRYDAEVRRQKRAEARGQRIEQRRTRPPATEAVVQVGERAKDNAGGAEVFGRPQVEEHQKEPLGALGRKAILEVRIDLPEPL